MRLFFCLLGLFLVQALTAQNRGYFERLDFSQPYGYDLEQASTATVDVLGFDEKNYSGIVHQHLNEKRAKRGCPAWQQDSVLNQLTHYGINSFPQSLFTKRKLRRRLTRYTELSLNRLNTNFRLFISKAFTVRLIDLKRLRYFYYERKDTKTELHLFKGNRPKISNPDHPEYIEPVAVEVMREDDFAADIEAQLYRLIGKKYFNNRLLTHLSIALRLDKNSIHRKKAPQAFVYIIIAGKQTQKIKRKIIQNNVADSTAYTILR